MGATGWTYYAPYISDPQVALDRLRQETFQAGSYKLPGSERRTGLELLLRYHSDRNDPHAVAQIRMALNMVNAVERGSDASLTAAERRALNQARRLKAADGYIPWVTQRGGRPSTIEELLDAAAEQGTHSILDITRIATRRHYGAATPLAKRKLKAAFGADKPTRGDLEAGDWSFEKELDRWQAVYFVIYDNGQPNEYCFVGCSGD